MLNDHLFSLIQTKLESIKTVDSIIAAIEDASETGKIAFFPFGRLTRDIVSKIKKDKPALLGSIIGCFDNSKTVSPEEGVTSYHIRELDSYSSEISLLVVASNTFHNKEVRSIEENSTYTGKMLKTSFFELSFEEGLGAKEIIGQARQVYNMLADEKSRATYMIAWLTRVFNDEQLTWLFESETEADLSEPVSCYGYRLNGISAACKKELHSELYYTKPVAPQEGDYVLDIGAYKGDTAAFFAHHVGESGRVYAIEPVKPNFEVLRQNIESNNLEKVIVPLNKGVSSESGNLRVVSIDEGAPWSYLSEDKGYEVEVDTVDRIVEDLGTTRLDFIKMDVEGLEEQVLRGAVQTLGKLAPKLALAIYHKTSDLTLLPLLINRLQPSYRMYVRSKIEGAFGFTLYCIADLEK